MIKSHEPLWINLRSYFWVKKCGSEIIMYSVDKSIIVNFTGFFYQSHGYVGMLLMDITNKSGQLGRRGWGMCFILKIEVIKELWWMRINMFFYCCQCMLTLMVLGNQLCFKIKLQSMIISLVDSGNLNELNVCIEMKWSVAKSLPTCTIPLLWKDQDNSHKGQYRWLLLVRIFLVAHLGFG